MKKNRITPTSAILIIIFTAGTFYLFFGNLFTSPSKFDVADQQNDKIVDMFNKQVEQEIENHTQSVMYPGFIPEARQNTIDYLKSIQSIESYARDGVESAQPRNYLELNIVFNDGTVAKKVYTGYTCSAYLGPCLLMKVEMRDGKAVKVFTNGQEKKGSPNWIIPDLNILINKAITYDIIKNHNKYFPPQKSQQDFDKEWENQK
ncbi:hypothetical protein PFY12_04795 [Chryseobacterium camelliae]|uniref:DUF4468 domain-containing protein n=1 Tax=Chryseobacterium camelliae TaxID=1265445 RepID=A0ABY7QP42_9FLAO|nr:hypothetical protein [Chryseobacterium camelliae]WBV61442.1 hypothetical protein PFY12_04795 [Chryseobacterium camelliae]